jgi:hypothetical protein
MSNLYFPMPITHETAADSLEETWGVDIDTIFEVKTVQRDPAEDLEALKQEFSHLEDDVPETVVVFKSPCLKEPMIVRREYLSAIKAIEVVLANGSFIEDEGQLAAISCHIACGLTRSVLR